MFRVQFTKESSQNNYPYPKAELPSFQDVEYLFVSTPNLQKATELQDFLNFPKLLVLWRKIPSASLTIAEKYLSQLHFPCSSFLHITLSGSKSARWETAAFNFSLWTIWIIFMTTFTEHSLLFQALATVPLCYKLINLLTRLEYTHTHRVISCHKWVLPLPSELYSTYCDPLLYTANTKIDMGF